MVSKKVELFLRYLKLVFVPDAVFIGMALAIMFAATYSIPDPNNSIACEVIVDACMAVSMLFMIRLIKKKIFPIVRNNTRSMLNYCHDELHEWLDEAEARESWDEIKAKIERTGKAGMVLVKLFVAGIIVYIVYSTIATAIGFVSGERTGLQAVQFCGFLTRVSFAVAFSIVLINYALVPSFQSAIAKAAVADMKKRAWKD